jgi:hypothetical protein
MITSIDLISQYPMATKTQVNAAVKYQDNFQLTLDNLKCLNPNCSNIRKWQNTKYGFYYTCGNKSCIQTTKNMVSKLKSNKIKKTNLQKYGVTSTAQLESTKQKAKETCLIRYGVSSPGQLESTKQKAKETCLIRYGVDNKSKLPETKKKARDTYFKKTGYYHNSQTPEFKDFHNKKYITNYINWNNKEFKGTSLQEQTIIPFLESLDLKVETNVRNILPNMELDIWLPEIALAIEWNGIYWHSYHETNGTNIKQLDYNYMKYRHQQKSIACIERGIRLLHLYEDQHLDNWYEAIISFILYEQEDTKIYDLDTGCYPIDITNISNIQIFEPVARIVCNDRILWNAGYINLEA